MKMFGSISLKGGLIDDITFKKYNRNLEKDKKVKYLNPSETNDGYFVETGWAASNLKKYIFANKKFVYGKLVGNNKLKKGNPLY